jgi:hypothetical protein
LGSSEVRSAVSIFVLRPLPCLALAVALLLAALPASARHTKPRVRYDGAWQSRPSARYATLGKAACSKELAARKIAFTSLEKAPGVLAPVRLTGALGGVVFRTEAPAGERATSPNEVYDCRLVLALHDWSKVLTANGIDEVRTLSAWRPGKNFRPRGKLATRHAGGLAVDVKRFGKKLAAGEQTKRWIAVDADFHGKIGAPVCGAGAAAQGPTGPAQTLRAVVCSAGDQRLFTSILTPNYNRAHRDHLHVEVRPAVKWFLLL